MACLFSWRHAILKSDIHSTTKHVLLTLACHMNELGESCFPSINTLAEETSLSERSVRTQIKSAQELGWIKVGLHGFGGQKWRSHEYSIGWPKVRNDVPQVGEKGAEPCSEGAEPNDTNVRNDVPTSTSVNSTTNTTRPRRRGTRCTIDEYLEQCKADDVRAIKPDAAVVRYAEEAGISTEMLRVCFREFVEKYRVSGKQQKDWPGTFLNCVRSNWYRLWWVDESGKCQPTSLGRQALNVHEAA